MAKPKNPLMSLDAHGSLGNALTFQERHQQALVRTKPIPKQPNSLPQIYHRWDYQDYALLWHALSVAAKQQYESDARRSRITGFNLWMRNSLNDLPNLLLRTYLDEGGGVVAYDSSRGEHNGTLLAPSWIDGRLGKALSFDGVNDYVTFGNSLDLVPTREFSVEILVYPMRAQEEFLASRGARQPWDLRYMNGPLRLWIRNTAAAIQSRTSTITLTQNRWNYVLVVYDPDNLEIRFQIDSAQETQGSNNWDLQQTVGVPTGIGAYVPIPGLFDFLGYLDHFSLYSRAITPAEGLTRYDRIRRQ